jgi:hypothetical protein
MVAEMTTHQTFFRLQALVLGGLTDTPHHLFPKNAGIRQHGADS